MLPDCGELDALYKKATTVNAKHGPFDAVLCVGEFVGTDKARFDKYLSGETKGMPSQHCILLTVPDSPDTYVHHGWQGSTFLRY